MSQMLDALGMGMRGGGAKERARLSCGMWHKHTVSKAFPRQAL